MRAVLILLLVIAGATACRTGAAVDAHKAFSDPAVAALARAAAEGDAARVRELVAQGVDPNAQGDRGVTPLEFAMLAQSVDGMRALLAAGADPTVGRLFDAGGAPRPGATGGCPSAASRRWHPGWRRGG